MAIGRTIQPAPQRRPTAGDRRRVGAFLFVTIAVSWAPVVAAGVGKGLSSLWMRAPGGSAAFWILAAAPAVASAAVGLVLRDPAPWRFRWRLSPRWLLISLAVALAWLAGILLLGSYTRLSEWPMRGMAVSTALSSALRTLVRVGVPLAILQEAGWRGFLLPRLLRYGRVGASLLTGLAWAASLAPVLLMTNPYRGAPDPVRYAALGLHLVLLSLVMTWLYCGSGRSLWVTVLSNALLWTFAGEITRPGILDGMPILVGARGILGSMFLVLWSWTLYLQGAFRPRDGDRARPA